MTAPTENDDTIILAATDGTDRSRAVLSRAQMIAAAWNARLALVHVRSTLSGRFRLSLARDSKEELAKALVAHGGVEDDLYLLDGPPADAVAQLAKRLGARLVVLGPHRERRVLDTFRLTTMERITLAVDCPVLVARAFPPRPYTRVLAALSFEPVCATGMVVAARLASGAEFSAIHALPVPLPATLAQRGRTRSMAEARMAEFMQAEGLPPAMPPPEIVRGGVHEVLRYRITEWGPDLLVIARNSGDPSGKSPARLGNYARDLMRAPPTDMLVTPVPARPGVRPGPATGPDPARQPEQASDGARPDPTDGS